MWAAGNGWDHDSCAADGYVQSIYTIAVGALQSNGERAVYDERCSAKVASAFVTHTQIFSTVSQLMHYLVLIFMLCSPLLEYYTYSWKMS